MHTFGRSSTIDRRVRERLPRLSLGQANKQRALEPPESGLSCLIRSVWTNSQLVRYRHETSYYNRMVLFRVLDAC